MQGGAQDGAHSEVLKRSLYLTEKEILFFRTILSLDPIDKAGAVECGGDGYICRRIEFDGIVSEQLICSIRALEVCIKVLVRARAIAQHVNVVRPILPGNPDPVHGH